MKIRSWGVYSGPSKSGAGRAYGVVVSEIPLWKYVIGSAIDHFPPRWTYRIKFPDIWERKWGGDEWGPSTLREWYGSLGSVLLVWMQPLYAWSDRWLEKYDRAIECNGTALKEATKDIVGEAFFHDA